MARIIITNPTSWSPLITHPTIPSDLFRAVIAGNYSRVEEILRGPVLIHEEMTHNSGIGHGKSYVQPIQLVQLSVIRNSPLILSRLLEYGANVNSSDSAGTSLLHHAASHNYVDCIKGLLKFHVNISAKNIMGHTALDVARHLHNESVVLLLEEEQVEKEKCVAFAMGHHERLGKQSIMKSFDPEVMRMVLELV